MFLENEMFLHEDKCSILYIKKKEQVKMWDHIVETMNSQKDLGAVVRKNHSWTANANRRFSKAMRELWNLKINLSNKTSVINKLNAYNGYLVPIISYASKAWHPNKGDLASLEKIQKSATKWILGNSTDYKNRLLTLNFLPFAMYMELHSLLLYLRRIQHKCKSV